jgi:pyridoxal phosphate enzyme (YggS family)
MADTKAYSDIIKYLKTAKVKLVAVSKTKTTADILKLYDAGQRTFGENYVQELVDKHEKLPKDIEWHFIGHLQTNKIKYIAPFIHTIQSLDSLKLLKEIDKQALKHSRSINCLLQIHVAEEETKTGLSFDEARQILLYDEVKGLKNIKITGLMAMSTLTDNEQQIHREFHSVKLFFDEINNQLISHSSPLINLSMGMSSDYKMAIEEGSTMVRIGSLIFGERRKTA